MAAQPEDLEPQVAQDEDQHDAPDDQASHLTLYLEQLTQDTHAQAETEPAAGATAPNAPSTWSREQIIAELIRRGTRRDRAVLYTDSYTEYRDAQANVLQHGIFVKHEKTDRVMPNPFLIIRDKAWRRLATMKRVKADWLW